MIALFSIIILVIIGLVWWTGYTYGIERATARTPGDFADYVFDDEKGRLMEFAPYGRLGAARQEDVDR